eukprot:SAG22_NODE_1062_length_5759_cov_11.271025_4_plen_111_part_00
MASVGSGGDGGDGRLLSAPPPPLVAEDEVSNMRRMARYYFPGRESVLIGGVDLDDMMATAPYGAARDCSAESDRSGGGGGGGGGGSPGGYKPRQLCVGRPNDPANLCAGR